MTAEPPDTPTSPDALTDPVDELHAYRQAIEEEFKREVEAAPDNVDELTHDFFKKNAVAAAAQIVYLSQNANSDSVRLSASKLVLENARDEAAKDGDTLRQLLDEFTNNDPVAEPEYVEDTQ